MRILVTGGSGFIGTHLMEALSASGEALLNIDVNPPTLDAHRPYWRQVDIKDAAPLRQAITDFRPEAVVHLAARATFDGTTLADFPDNVEGTKTLLAALQDCAADSLQRVLVTSTQYVMGPGRVPAHDEDYATVNAYGDSKVETERLTRTMPLPCPWVIVRPTNIWGPYHPHYGRELFRYLGKRWYLHPGGAPIVRAYGYAGNVAHQIRCLLRADAAEVAGRVFYLGDEPADSYVFLNALTLGLSGKPMRVIPRPLLRGIALGGDLLRAIGIKFPMVSDRYHRMTSEHLVPMEPTLRLCGPGPYSLEQGVAVVRDWMAAGAPSGPPRDNAE